jgi:hypothetical protein
MKRPSLAVIAVVIAVAVAVGALVMRRSATRSGSADTAAADQRAFVSDSLAMRIRVPDTGWTLQRDRGVRADGRVTVANNQDSTATVRVFVLPAAPETTVEGLFAARKKQIASVFGVDNLDKVIATTVRDETKDVGGHRFRQWQAVSQGMDEPGGTPKRLMFMWLMTVTPQRTYECLGLVRFPVMPTAEEQPRIDATLRDVAYVLQSFEVF